MERKYNVGFCSCGRIHVRPVELDDWMAEDCDNRDVIEVCQNCGATYRHWLTKDFDPDFGDCFCSHGDDVDEGELNNDRQHRIFFGYGIRIPLVAGGYAEAYQANTYINWNLLRKLSIGSVYEAERTNSDAIRVDVQRLIREVNNDEILYAISSYISGIDWSGTKYDIRTRKGGEDD